MCSQPSSAARAPGATVGPRDEDLAVAATRRGAHARRPAVGPPGRTVDLRAGLGEAVGLARTGTPAARARSSRAGRRGPAADERAAQRGRRSRPASSEAARASSGTSETSGDAAPRAARGRRVGVEARVQHRRRRRRWRCAAGSTGRRRGERQRAEPALVRVEAERGGAEPSALRGQLPWVSSTGSGAPVGARRVDHRRDRVHGVVGSRDLAGVPSSGGVAPPPCRAPASRAPPPPAAGRRARRPRRRAGTACSATTKARPRQGERDAVARRARGRTARGGGAGEPAPRR